MLRGVLPINKPIHLSSYDCIRKLKPLFPNTKLGHAGTLDPIAEGLLIILFNEATKIAQYLSDKDKEYIARIRLGITTDTDDITGQIIKDCPCDDITEKQVKEVLTKFVGEQKQVPPKFSALKQQGKRSYELARKGVDFTLAPRKINIKAIEIIHFDLPMIEIKTTVSKGTYIRALARDIGEQLDCGATLEGLIRTQIGSFRIENAMQLSEISKDNIGEILYPINEVLSDMPPFVVSEPEMEILLKGQPILLDSKNKRLEDSTSNRENSLVRVVDNQNRILIIGNYKNNSIYPDRVIYADI
jgi:tRNA pseudouridine55 synthase